MNRLQRYQTRWVFSGSVRWGISLRSGLMKKLTTNRHDRRKHAEDEDPGLPGDHAEQGAGDAEGDGDEGRPRRVVDAPPDPAEERRDEGERAEDHHQHADRRGDGDALHEAQAHEEQAHQGDDHGEPGEQHGAAARVDRLDDGLLHAQPELQALPVAGDDEQGVVDADAEADHRHHLHREVGHRDEVAEQRDEGGADAESEQGRADRQPHRQHRTEGQDEDDDGGDDAVDLALRELELAERITAVLDGQPLDAGVLLAVVLDLRAEVEDLLEPLVGDVELGVGDVTLGLICCGLS